MKLSVIVPVYQAEAYLERCLDSLLAQSLEDMEIILVNDGSTDGSQAIIERYLARYPERLQAMSVDNGGQGRARNFGIQRARGEFLGFVDSDDWVDADMFRLLVEAAERESADVAVCALEERRPDGSAVYLPAWRAGRPIAAAGSASNKIFRREAVGELRFPQGLWYEDLDFSAKLLLCSRKTVYLPQALYFYRCGQTSTMHNDNAVKNLDMLTVMEDIRLFMEENGGSRDDFEFMVLNHVLLDSINRLALQSDPRRKDVIRRLRDYAREQVPDLSACKSYREESRNRRIVMGLNYAGREELSRLLLAVKRKL